MSFHWTRSSFRQRLLSRRGLALSSVVGGVAAYQVTRSPDRASGETWVDDVALYYNSLARVSKLHLESPQDLVSHIRPDPAPAPPSREEMLRAMMGSQYKPHAESAAASLVHTAASYVYGLGTYLGASIPSYEDLNKASAAVPPQTVADLPPPEEEFDLLVIGGGATGAGVAVDAASRGLSIALAERNDFSSGTSSKSTKLVHGGVRYLQKAILELDYEQYKLVKEALAERRTFLYTAPYLSHPLPIMIPVYTWWQLPYYYAGSKLYDLFAGSQNMESAYWLGKGKALEQFPTLKSDGLSGAVVYYDGQHNDSRMNMALIMSAVHHGAKVANYTEAVQLIKDETGRIRGARLRDNLTGREWNVRAKGVINATGPFSDGVRKLDEPLSADIVSPASGVHITLPNYFAPAKMGLIDPATSDGRVIFFLPWQGTTIAGTTDSPSSVTQDPIPSEEDIEWILNEVSHYLSPDIHVQRSDVLSAWNGIRPLVKDPSAKNTEALVRNHLINVSASGLLTIAGGKWTTYRAMAEETVDEAIKTFKLTPTNGCVTAKTQLIGSHGWSPMLFIKLIQHFGVETSVAKYLTDNYGDRAWDVCDLAPETGLRWPVRGTRLDPIYPYTDAEVRYACRREYAQRAIDVIARRTRLSFINADAALDALPRVLDIMKEECGWSPKRVAKEFDDAKTFLLSMGLKQEDIAHLSLKDVRDGRHKVSKPASDKPKKLRLWPLKPRSTIPVEKSGGGV